MPLTSPARSQHVYEVRPRKDKRGVDLICDALPFGRLWYGEPNAISNAIGYATHRSRSHHAVIRVYDDAGNVIETHEGSKNGSKAPSVAPSSARARVLCLHILLKLFCLFLFPLGNDSNLNTHTAKDFLLGVFHLP